MLEITTPVHGSILNRHHGHETEDALEIVVTGCADAHLPVTVNGVAAERRGLQFSAPVRLATRETAITAEMRTVHGTHSQTVRVLWDRKSFARFSFFIDDHIFFIEDIVRGGYDSIFGCFYLENLRRIHRETGVKVVLNMFFRNDHGDGTFDLTQMPDRYKGEFLDNADWLRLSFHAFSEFPDRPYANATPEKLAADYDRVREEIVRFAGEATFEPPMVLHWAECPPSCLPVLYERGVRVLSGQFVENRALANPTESPLFETGDIGYFLDRERIRLLSERGTLHDFDSGITFAQGDACCNRIPTEQIIAALEKSRKADPPRDIIDLASHEQYSFPFYKNYIPEHFDRIEAAARYASEHGYRPVFANEGFFGNTTDVPA